jgi:hypothetical protein
MQSSHGPRWRDGGGGAGFTRRGFLKLAAAGALGAAVGPLGSVAAPSEEREAMAEAKRWFNVRDFGAKGDGTTDDTAAIQRAIDAAAEAQATVYVPEGVFLCSALTLRPQMGLLGDPAWRYSKPGGSVLRLGDEKARCLLDMTEANGATVNGLSLDGQRLGEGVHGILVDKPEYRTEDAFRIERCQVGRFSGDGVRLNRIWCFSMRNSMVCYNGGDGMWLRGWDGFLLDNWFSGNRRAGYGAYEENASMMLTGNRIEWNRAGGVVCHSGNGYNITGNYFDRSGGPGIVLLGPNGPCSKFTITGNIINRSGAPWHELEKHDSAQVRFENCRGLVFTGNAMCVGRDDGNKGEWSPRCGIVYGRLENSIIKDNVLHTGALEELLVDLGDHGPGAIVKDNPGSLGTPW